jgi:hypothetical protein
VSRWTRRLLVVTGARCPLTKPVVTAVELQAATEPHCSRGVQPGGIYVYVVQRGPTPGGPGSGLRPKSKRFLCQLPLWFCSGASCRSGSIHIYIIECEVIRITPHLLTRKGWCLFILPGQFDLSQSDPPSRRRRASRLGDRHGPMLGTSCGEALLQKGLFLIATSHPLSHYHARFSSI